MSDAVTPDHLPRPEAGTRATPRWVAEREIPGRRLFFAVPLPDEAAHAIAALVDQVRAEVAVRFGAAGPGARTEREVRWVRMDGLHLTLRFIGPTLDDRLPVLEALLDAVAAERSPFRVTIAGAGAFPGPVRPRVLWLGIDDGAAELTALADDLGRRLADEGWPPDERPFRPHLSLARADGVHAGTATAAALVAAAGPFRRSFTADRLVLYESHTGGGPARYEPLAEARFTS